MSLFPLYDQITKKMDGTETSLTKNNCDTILRLNQDHLNIIYLLILHSYRLKNNNSTNLPYGCKTVSNGKGISFRRLTQIPENVQKIISRYLSMITI